MNGRAPAGPRTGWADVVVVAVDLTPAAVSTVRTVDRDDLVDNVAAVVTASRIAGAPVLFAAPALPGPAGRFVPELTAAAPDAITVAHATVDAWADDRVREAVQATGRPALVVLGVATDVGVGLTALSARAAGHRVHVVVDASGTVSAAAEQAAWLRMGLAGVQLVSWSGLVGELTGDYTRGVGPQLRALVGRRLAGPFTDEGPTHSSQEAG